MHVFYITFLGVLGALCGYLAHRVQDYKSELGKTIKENQALDQGMDELAQINHDQELTIIESLATIQEQTLVLREREGRVGELSLQVVDYEEQISNLEKDLSDKRMLIVASNERINEYKLLLDAAQGRARDLDEIATFHANNCMPHLSEIRSGRFPTAPTGG